MMIMHRTVILSLRAILSLLSCPAQSLGFPNFTLCLNIFLWYAICENIYWAGWCWWQVVEMKRTSHKGHDAIVPHQFGQSPKGPLKFPLKLLSGMEGRKNVIAFPTLFDFFFAWPFFRFPFLLFLNCSYGNCNHPTAFLGLKTIVCRRYTAANSKSRLRKRKLISVDTACIRLPS